MEAAIHWSFHSSVVSQSEDDEIGHALPLLETLHSFPPGRIRLSKPIYCRLLKPLALLVGSVLLSGCTGEENIPLKKVDYILEAPKEKPSDKPKNVTRKGASSRIGHDPSGVNKN